MKEVCFIFSLYTVSLSFAYVNYPIKAVRDGSKTEFIQTPYINSIPEKLDGLRKEVSVYWPKGMVYYRVDPKSYGPNTKLLVENAMSVIQSTSCLNFKSLSYDVYINKTWLHISNPNKERECLHEPVYKEKGEVMITLGYDCLNHRDILHGLLHGIGFKDEVTHPHRDKYIRVLWTNIHPAYRHLYRKQGVDASKKLVEYDPLSVMQFHDRAFSVNGKATIAALEPGLAIAPSDGLSQLDKLRLSINFMQECNKRKVDDLIKTCKTSLKTNAGTKMADVDSNSDDEGDTKLDEEEINPDENENSNLQENEDTKLAEEEQNPDDAVRVENENSQQENGDNKMTREDEINDDNENGVNQPENTDDKIDDEDRINPEIKNTANQQENTDNKIAE